jgi:hypothetical protein
VYRLHEERAVIWAAAITAGAFTACFLTVTGFYTLAWTRGWRIGKLSWPLADSRGACRRCTTAWRFVRPHFTPYDVTRRGTRLAMWPLCERCWDELQDGEQRYPYYADELTAALDRARQLQDTEEQERIRRSATNVTAALRAGL